MDDAPEWHWLRVPQGDDCYGDPRKTRGRDHHLGDSGESASIGTSERLSPPSTTSRLSDSEVSELDYDDQHQHGSRRHRLESGGGHLHLSSSSRSASKKKM
ncbi:unnamed protein product, partial [Notodromas monacha]